MNFRMLSSFSVSCLMSVAGLSHAAEVVNVYSSRHYEVDQEVNDAFTKATGIQVNLVAMKEAGQILERLKAEGKNSPADVLLTVDFGNLSAASTAGLLGKLNSEVVEKKVPAALRDEGNEWTSIAFRARVIAFDKTKIKAGEIKDYEDLAKAQWKGKVLVRSSNHIYNQSLTASILKANGEASTEDWAKKVTENLARKPEGGDTDQLKGIAAGRGQIAIVNSYYAGRLLGSSKPEDKKIMENIELVFPNQSGRGTHINVSGAGILKNSPHAPAARKYIEFWLSPEIQAKLSNVMYEFPVIKGAELSPVLKSFGAPKFDSASLTQLALQAPLAVRILDRAGWR